MSLPHYAVFGHPVAHSLSPRIHAAFGRQFGLPIIYVPIDTGTDGFATALERFALAGGIGANVTVPHKGDAARLCQQLGHAAQQAGAVNTLIQRDGLWIGENTDGSGLVRDLEVRRNLDLDGLRTLILGAGGAAQGIAPALLEAGIGELVIANRNPARACELAERLAPLGTVNGIGWDTLPHQASFDLIIQATSLGHEGMFPALPSQLVNARSVCIDLNYGRAALGFMAWARQQGCPHVHDGLGMLVEQAAIAFELWHGLRPDTHPVYTQMRLLAQRR